MSVHKLCSAKIFRKIHLVIQHGERTDREIEGIYLKDTSMGVPDQFPAELTAWEFLYKNII